MRGTDLLLYSLCRRAHMHGQVAGALPGSSASS
jgi:hypothetical protein